MKLLKASRHYLWISPLVLLALAGLVWGRPKPDQGKVNFGLDSVEGRYISAENAYDVSSVHPLAAPNGSIAGGPVFFATAEVMQADGNGNVCGEADGFYGGFPPPGVNTGPSLFHGTYTVEAVTGRVTILTASDGAPSLANIFCGTIAPINTSGSAVYKTQVGYIQNGDANKIVTVEQINNSDASKGGCCASTGFLVHKHTWTRASGEGEGDQHN